MIKRLIREKGSEAIVITSDREVSKFAERMNAAVVPSEQFQEKLEGCSRPVEGGFEEEEEEKETKKKGLSRRLSKKEKRARAALKKL